MDNPKGSGDNKIRIAVVDDHPIYRDGVSSTLAGDSRMEVIALGDDASEAISIVEDHLPDIILLDVTMPGNGLKCAAVIGERFPYTKIIMLTVSEDEEDLLEAFRAGARAYVLKGVGAKELVNIVSEVFAGEVYVTPTLASRVLVEMSSSEVQSEAVSAIETLTKRELQILERVASGDSNKEIAYDLKISEKTVKHYMTNIMQKLHARNRVEAALLAHDAGFGQLPDSSQTDPDR